uniref:Uncharacterized protein n=1 Tax=Ditylenchus dipsaci TaxID=166011 RepID=A0A915DFX8_9BILA
MLCCRRQKATNFENPAECSIIKNIFIMCGCMNVESTSYCDKRFKTSLDKNEVYVDTNHPTPLERKFFKPYCFIFCCCYHLIMEEKFKDGNIETICNAQKIVDEFEKKSSQVRAGDLSNTIEDRKKCDGAITQNSQGRVEPNIFQEN